MTALALKHIPSGIGVPSPFCETPGCMRRANTKLLILGYFAGNACAHCGREAHRIWREASEDRADA